jgi:Lon protease-like protein
MLKSLLQAVSETVRTKGAAPTSLPVFPLGSVLFPGGLLSLRIFENRYMDMAKACLKNGSPFGVALIKSGCEVGAAAEPEKVGTLARILEWDMQELGILQIRVMGEQRFRLCSHYELANGLLIGEMELIQPDLAIECPELPPCAAFLRKVLTQTGRMSTDSEARLADAEWVSLRITEMLPFSNTVKQKMLELTDVRMRLEVLHRFLHDQQLIAA